MVIVQFLFEDTAEHKPYWATPVVFSAAHYSIDSPADIGRAISKAVQLPRGQEWPSLMLLWIVKGPL